MNNIPEVKVGLVAVSRDCFPVELSRRRRRQVMAECQRAGLSVIEIETVVEREADLNPVLQELATGGVNALVIYLGNFGPEGPTSLLAQKFAGPVMLVAAAEEKSQDLVSGRGDAFCGLLSTNFNLGLRGLKVYLPEYPVGIPREIAGMIKEFIPIARIWLGVKNLKIFSFGPRPADFYTCQAPLRPLYRLGVEIMENSELDLYDLYKQAEGDPRIKEVVEEMAQELGPGNTFPQLLPQLAQYEVALLNFFEDNLGTSSFAVFANKCWPAFERYFGFVPCYVNARLAAKGIPVACEADVYGALSEYLAICATQLPATLLDINNTVPPDMWAEIKSGRHSYQRTDLFMGFHCGNTPAEFLLNPTLKYQLIMHRLLEGDREPKITRGTLEGRLRPGEVTIFRLQAAASRELKAYIAEGEILDVDPRSFGCLGVLAIKEMGRFYRHVLLEKQFPHHAAVAFRHCGRSLWAGLRLLGLTEIGVSLPAGSLYPSENPFGQS